MDLNNMPIEDIYFLVSQFDVVISSLALHYLFFWIICQYVYNCFVFSVEHPSHLWIIASFSRGGFSVRGS